MDGSGDRCIWVDSSYGYIPDGAMLSGEDLNGEPLFVSRVVHNPKNSKKPHVLPGKLVPGYQKCYVAYKKREHEYVNYQVLIECKGMKWKKAINGDKFINGVTGGSLASQKPLFIGRAEHMYGSMKTMISGYFMKDKAELHYPFGGKEYITKDFEYLCCEH